jgi:hypothetical protein
MKHEQRVAIVEKPYDVQEKESPFGLDVQGEYVVFLRLEQGNVNEARRG